MKKVKSITLIEYPFVLAYIELIEKYEQENGADK